MGTISTGCAPLGAPMLRKKTNRKKENQIQTAEKTKLTDKKRGENKTFNHKYEHCWGKQTVENGKLEGCSKQGNKETKQTARRTGKMNYCNLKCHSSHWISR